MPLGIGARRAADIVAFRILDDEQAMLMRIGAHALECPNAIGAIALEEPHLGLHRRHDTRDGIDDVI